MSARKKLTQKKKKDSVFVAILLAYPVLQFVLVWSFVNIGSVLMAFKKVNVFGEETWGFYNFINVIKDLFDSPSTATGINWLNNNLITLLNSFGYGIVTIFIILPLSLVFSYFLHKGVPLSNTFRIIFFLPNVIPVVALTMAYNMPLNMNFGYIYAILKAFGFKNSVYAQWPTSQLFVYIYCVWAGLGYNIILMSGAIGRIPKEIFESAQLDGAGYWVEFTKITIPLIWSTIVTLVVLGLTNVLTLYMQPYLLTEQGTKGYVSTIAMEIFVAAGANNPSTNAEMAAKGLLFTVIWAPIVLVVRHFISKKYADVDF